MSKGGALTGWRAPKEGQVRTQKESEQWRGTHFLESTKGGSSEDTERKSAREGHSQTGEHQGRVK